MRAETPAAGASPRARLPHVWLALLLFGAPLAAATPRAAGAQAPVEAPLLAVLPFEVHSAKPLGYLGESIANLIRSRLEASGEVRVLDAASVRQRVGKDGVDATSEAALRQLARDLDSAYVVTGSLTELAGRYSLDVRVTPGAVAQPGRTLIVTAEREEELLDRVNELADQVLGEVVEAAPATVVAVEISGAGARTAELEGRLRTRIGEPYDPAAVGADLDALRGDPGLASAAVATERGPGGIAVRFEVAPAQPTVRGAPGAKRGQVAEVRVRGNRRIEADAIRARIGTRAGGPYRPSQIAKDVREIHALGFFRDVRVSVETAPDGGRIVVFEVEENPVVRQISISGNDHVDSDKIRDILTLTLGSALDYPLLYENRGRIQALYKAEGYYLAEVAYEIEPLSGTAVGIHFIVTENEKLKLREIQFVGNEQFSDRKLREGFKVKRWRIWSYATSWLDHSGTYSEPLFLQDLRKVEKLYTDAGYLQVEIGKPEVIASANGLVVSVPIVEGRQFRVGALDVAGDDTVDIDALREKLRLKEGEIFNRSYLTADVAALTEHYTNRGFYFANVAPLSDLSEKDETVDVIFQVQKGPLYFIRNIDVSGNTVTVDPVIRREIPIVEGELYSQREILLSRARVKRLGFFEEVDFEVEPTDEPDQIDLAVKVVERPTGSFSFGAGYSSQDSFVATGSLSQDNLFGRGYAVRFSADYGGRTQRFYLSVLDPYFLGSDFSFGVTLYNTSLNYEDFDQSQTGAEFFVGHALTEDNRARGTLRYQLASREIEQDSNARAAAVIYRELFQEEVTLSLVGLSVGSDTRDDRLSPLRGYQAAASLEFAGLGFFSRFLRAEARGTWYLGAPWWLLDKSTFAVSSRIGYALGLNSISDFDFPTDENGDLFPVQESFDGNILPLQAIDTDIKLPLSERYFLGGLGEFQLRGFKGRSVGPRRPLLRPLSDGELGPVGRRATTVNRFTGSEVSAGHPLAMLGTVCDDNGLTGGDGDGKCNDIDDTRIEDFEDLDETDVIGGNKFISSSFEYRFPISETVGLQGVLFLDVGNAFAEGENLFDVTEWRYGTGVGVQWFSPFGPLAVILGFPLDPLEDEDSPVFEFSVGGHGF